MEAPLAQRGDEDDDAAVTRLLASLPPESREAACRVLERERMERTGGHENYTSLVESLTATPIRRVSPCNHDRGLTRPRDGSCLAFPVRPPHGAALTRSFGRVLQYTSRRTL